MSQFFSEKFLTDTQNPDDGLEKIRVSLEFEELISDLSRRFIGLPSPEIDSQINKSLKLIIDFLDIDRCSIFYLVENQNYFKFKYGATRDGLPLVPSTLSTDVFPWCTERLLKGEFISFAKLSDLPDEAELDRRSFHSHQIKSNTVFPLSLDGKVRAILTFGPVKKSQNKSDCNIYSCRIYDKLNIIYYKPERI